MSLLVASDLTVSLAHAAGPTPMSAPVLRGVSLSLAPGRVLGLVGESGAGKSMLGRAVAQALPRGFAVTGGSLAFDDADLVAMRPAARRALLGRDIAFIPQEPLSALNPVRSVGAQFAEHLRHIGVPRGARRARMLAALEAVHLPDPAALLGHYPHQLSGGMCQRVLIAMAFASEPLLVIADEPTTALDVTIQARIMELMAELQAMHRTAILFITHDLRLAASVCDEIAVLYAGAIVEHGPARDVLAAPRHPYTRCLLLANPPLTGPPRALYALPDQMPGLLALASMQGCRFAPRCPLAESACHHTDPALSDGPHRVACLRPADTPGIAVTAAPPPPLMARAAAPLLEVAGLTKRFTTGPLWRRRETLAVDAASFSVRAGEFLAIVGESGSGKTTLGRLLMGLERPSAGRILLAGQDVTAGREAARRHRVATAQMVFQDPHAALNPRRRVATIVTQALEAAGIPAPERARRSLELLASMGLPPEAGRRVPSQLSGGQRQRVNIARALCLVPRLLVADEIVSGLDVSVQAQLLTLLQRLRAELDFAMVFISHDLAVVRHLCERVLVMHQGVIVEQGETAQVFAAPAHPYTASLLAAVPR
jgi:peptide/nickel transport system ATP-binding protein